MTSTLGKKTNYTLRAFGLGFLVAAAAFLPYIIYHGGYFFYYGDFNVQQIPFYQLAHEAIRSGDIWWNWYTDLGVNFIGSYSFYLLFSPFFWLTLPFPTTFLPYLMAPLLMLKHACAAVTAYWYLKRFIADKNCAVFCSLLYAFSGFTVYNIFFNHFHEVIVFFPLLLIGLEKAMTENKRGWFALAITANVLINYWFFVGEVVFVVVYFLVRLTSPQWRMSVRKFFSLAAETLLGMGLSLFGLLPSALAILGNPRMGTDALLQGGALWYYSNPQRYLGIIQNMFFAPDPPALNNFFPNHGATWASLAAYLPVVGAVGVMVYWFSRKKDWIKTLLGVSVIMAMVPLGNHLFVTLNHSYYARWFYMPTLIMVLATAKVLEHPEEYDITKGVRITAGVMLVLLIMGGLTPRKADGEWTFGLYSNAPRFLATVGITLLCFFAFLMVLRQRKKPQFRKVLYSTIAVGCCLFTFFYMMIGKVTYSNNQWISDALPHRNQMLVEDEPWARTDIYQGNDNLAMYWHVPSIQAFHSIVPVDLMTFYPDVGVKRDVSSKPDVAYYYLRPFLSVRWLYVAETNTTQDPMPNYTYADTRGGYNIYENDMYIPMGFSYDLVLSMEQWEELPQDWRSRALLYGITLDDETAEKYSDILAAPDEDWILPIASDEYEAMVIERRGMTCDTFEIDNRGFTATSSFDRERLVFFSVPYDAGWSATVNGQPVDVDKANIAFMAVRVPEGEATIRFTYTTPGLKIGLVISGVSLVLFAIFLITTRNWQPDPHDTDWNGALLADLDRENYQLSFNDLATLQPYEHPPEEQPTADTSPEEETPDIPEG